jgi:hypothetical protein
MTNQQVQINGTTGKQLTEGLTKEVSQRMEEVEPSEPNYEGFNPLGDYLKNDIRRARNQAIQARSCAYLAAFDMAAGSLWLRRTPIQHRDEPALTNALRKKLEADRTKGCMATAITPLRAIARERLNV